MQSRTFMLRFLFRLIVFLLGVTIAVVAAAWFVASRGFSARAQPTALEETIALRLRAIAMPRDAASTRNPVPDNAANLRKGLEHFADHCAICHGNDGSGNGEIGQGLYPKPPDLRTARTQLLRDGELFYIIENGIRFTGMPAFGGSHDGEDSWRLVQFIRHLPKVTDQELADMKRLNPSVPAERDEEHHADPPKSGTKAPHTHKRS